MKWVSSREHPGESRFYMVKSYLLVLACPCMFKLSLHGFLFKLHVKFVCLAENGVLVNGDDLGMVGSRSLHESSHGGLF